MAVSALGGVGAHHGGQAKLEGLMAKPDGGRWWLSSVSLPWQKKAVSARCKVVLGNLLGVSRPTVGGASALCSGPSVVADVA
jgi:hypothetical protein